MRWKFFSRAFEICLRKFCFKFSSFLRIPFFVTESKLDELTNAVKETDHIVSSAELICCSCSAELIEWQSSLLHERPRFFSVLRNSSTSFLRIWGCTNDIGMKSSLLGFKPNTTYYTAGKLFRLHLVLLPLPGTSYSDSPSSLALGDGQEHIRKRTQIQLLLLSLTILIM